MIIYISVVPLTIYVIRLQFVQYQNCIKKQKKRNYYHDCINLIYCQKKLKYFTIRKLNQINHQVRWYQGRN